MDGRWKGSSTDLAVEGAGVGDVLLGLVGIHCAVSVLFLELQRMKSLTSESLGDLRYSATVSKL